MNPRISRHQFEVLSRIATYEDRSASELQTTYRTLRILDRLQLIEFRPSIRWRYLSGEPATTPAITAAGLLALRVGR